MTCRGTCAVYLNRFLLLIHIKKNHESLDFHVSIPYFRISNRQQAGGARAFGEALVKGMDFLGNLKHALEEEQFF
jgi:hypothetical protein